MIGKISFRASSFQTKEFLCPIQYTEFNGFVKEQTVIATKFNVSWNSIECNKAVKGIVIYQKVMISRLLTGI